MTEANVQPPTEAAATLAAALLDLAIPAECLPGVVANLAILAQHRRIVEADEA